MTQYYLIVFILILIEPATLRSHGHGRSLFKGLTELKTLSLSSNKIGQLRDLHFLDEFKCLTLFEFDNNECQIETEVDRNGCVKLKSTNCTEMSLANAFQPTTTRVTRTTTSYTYNSSLIYLDIELLRSWGIRASDQVINASGRLIHTISTNTFSQFRNIERLDLSRNSLVSLNRDTFKFPSHSRARTSLKFINLSFNQLTEIRDYYFNDLAGLEHLDLSQNKIKSIDPTSFLNNKALDLLDLTNNEILVHYYLVYKNGVIESLPRHTSHNNSSQLGT